MIVGLRPGQRVALKLDGDHVVGTFQRIGARDEQVRVGPHRNDAAFVRLDDGQVVATPYYLLELP